MDVRLSGKKVARKLEPRSPERGSASHLYVDMLSAANEAGAWKNAQSDLVDVHDNSKGTQSITQFVRRREAASELRDLLVTMAQAAGLEGYIDTTELDVLNQAWESLEPLLLAFQDESIRPAVEGLLVTWEGTPEDLLTSLGDVNSRISLRTPPKRTSDPHTR
jgi:hypothetical protein